ncbi:DUF397 domain-containing protein [Nocardia beijingensis]|uniref:DUF397 domain-containing protein n=1 Tax=Nocardia beijingensis TaxID=95162 RepID=UPI001895A2A1|nr:DUF397 domain-containing protein [Nocardia beijingensis]MBF6470075.1 DUF397 domain-containing protein [Nocardia beijingensis]
MTGDLPRRQWFKSSYSGGGESCVEVAWLADGRVGVRDSKNPTGPTLTFTPGRWEAFTMLVAGEAFDRSL